MAETFMSGVWGRNIKEKLAREKVSGNSSPNESLNIVPDPPEGYTLLQGSQTVKAGDLVFIDYPGLNTWMEVFAVGEGYGESSNVARKNNELRR